MKNIEKEVKQLIESLEKLSEEYSAINMKYGAHNERNEIGDFELYLTEYELVKEQYIDNSENESLFLENLKSEFEADVINEVKSSLKNKSENWYGYAYDMSELLEKNFKILKQSVYNLINLLDAEKQQIYKKRLEAVVSLEKTQVKKYINVREFTEIYGKSSDWQRLRRKVIKNKLPFIQEKRRGNILYKVEDVDDWFMYNS